MSETTVSRWDDYLDVFTSPGRLFERRSDGKFGHAFIVFMVLFVVLFFASKSAMQPIFDAEFTRGIAAYMKTHPGVTAEQMEKGRGFAGVATIGFVVIGMPITLLLLGVAVLLAGRVAGGALSYAQGTTVAVFAMFPKLLDLVSGALQALLLDESRLNSRWAVSLGPARFLNPDTANPVMLSLVGRLDLFTLWVTVLAGLGIKVIGRTSAGQAAMGAIVVWLIGALPTLIQALRS